MPHARWQGSAPSRHSRLPPWLSSPSRPHCTLKPRALLHRRGPESRLRRRHRGPESVSPEIAKTEVRDHRSPRLALHDRPLPPSGWNGGRSHERSPLPSDSNGEGTDSGTGLAFHPCCPRSSRHRRLRIRLLLDGETSASIGVITDRLAHKEAVPARRGCSPPLAGASETNSPVVPGEGRPRAPHAACERYEFVHVERTPTGTSPPPAGREREVLVIQYLSGLRIQGRFMLLHLPVLYSTKYFPGFRHTLDTSPEQRHFQARSPVSRRTPTTRPPSTSQTTTSPTTVGGARSWPLGRHSRALGIKSRNECRHISAPSPEANATRSGASQLLTRTASSQATGGESQPSMERLHRNSARSTSSNPTYHLPSRVASMTARWSSTSHNWLAPSDSTRSVTPVRGSMSSISPVHASAPLGTCFAMTLPLHIAPVGNERLSFVQRTLSVAASRHTIRWASA